MVKQHIIKKQIFELTLPSQEHASAMQNEVSALFRNQVVSILDDCFDELCSRQDDPEAVWRIDTLELDLGRINRDELQEEFGNRIVAQLQTQLADGSDNGDGTSLARTRRQNLPGRNDETLRDAELVLYFLRYGVLPWWADSTGSTIVNDSWQRLIEDDSGKAQQIVRWCGADRMALDRFIHQISSELLAKTLALHSADDSGLILSLAREIKSLLREGRGLEKRGEEQIRLQVWRSFYTAIAHRSVTTPQFFREIVAALASWYGRGSNEFVFELRSNIETLSATGRVFTTLPTFLKKMAVATEERPTISGPANRVGLDIVAALGDKERLREIIFREDDDTILEAMRLHFPVAEEISNQIRKLLAALRASRILGKISFEEVVRPDFWRILLAGLSCGKKRSQLLEDTLQQLAKESGISYATLQMELDQGELVAGSDKEEEIESIMDDAFSDAEEVAVQNAGLILFWPFVARLFSGLDMIRDGSFVDGAARERAVFILQYLACGESKAPEYLLPLNKILCGLDLSAPVARESRLTDREQRGCDELLDAVIGHWQALKATSRNGFRRAFVQRRGQLSVRDNGWLLRVERMGHDVLLEKLPWSINLVKLPWLQELLVVEW